MAEQKYDIRIIGLDLDGTVFTDQKEITPRTLDAIARAAERGILVLPATGRPAAGVPEQFLRVPGVRYALTSNGATVTELSTGKRLVNLPFEKDLALQIYDLLQHDNCILDLFAEGLSYTTAESAALVDRYADKTIREYIRKTRQVVEDMRALIASHPHGVEKFSVIYPDPPEKDKARERVLCAFPDVEVTSSFVNNIEINAPGVDKGEGLLVLAKQLGYTREQVMAVGDSGNDLAMLQKAGLSVAMGNALPEIKAAAAYVTDDNNHDGVAKAIERFVLQ